MGVLLLYSHKSYTMHYDLNRVQIDLVTKSFIDTSKNYFIVKSNLNDCISMIYLYKKVLPSKQFLFLTNNSTIEIEYFYKNNQELKPYRIASVTEYGFKELYNSTDFGGCFFVKTSKVFFFHPLTNLEIYEKDLSFFVKTFSDNRIINHNYHDFKINIDGFDELFATRNKEYFIKGRNNKLLYFVNENKFDSLNIFFENIFNFNDTLIASNKNYIYRIYFDKELNVIIDSLKTNSRLDTYFYSDLEDKLYSYMFNNRKAIIFSFDSQKFQFKKFKEIKFTENKSKIENGFNRLIFDKEFYLNYGLYSNEVQLLKNNIQTFFLPICFKNVFEGPRIFIDFEIFTAKIINGNINFICRISDYLFYLEIDSQNGKIIQSKVFDFPIKSFYSREFHISNDGSGIAFFGQYLKTHTKWGFTTFIEFKLQE